MTRSKAQDRVATIIAIGSVTILTLLALELVLSSETESDPTIRIASVTAIGAIALALAAGLRSFLSDTTSPKEDEDE